MAQKITLVDDIDGTPIDGTGGTVRFSIDAYSYEIDLTADNTRKLYAALDEFVTNARRTRLSAVTDRGASVAGAARKNDPARLKAIREWANANGQPVSDRGRVPQSIVDAYQAAH
jgi:hypothetical protein